MAKTIEVQLQEANDEIAKFTEIKVAYEAKLQDLESEKATLIQERDVNASLVEALTKKVEELSTKEANAKEVKDDVFTLDGETYQIVTPVISIKNAEGKMQAFKRAEIVASTELQAALVNGKSAAIKKL